ncbi:sugar transferase [Dorea formicigenerans]|nr:sugar transferase [Dorea formicigenerans]
MSKKKVIGCVAAGITVATAVTAKVMRNKAQKSTYKAGVINSITPRKMGFYEKYVKRAIDITCATGAIVVFSPLYLGVALLVRTKLGSPVLFTQDRPGLIGPDGKETVFKMYKFRSMTDERDENGKLLPDDVRLTKFGKWLRNTSLDELPEAFNILNGTMSVIGPRPQLVRDMVFMTDEQRMRHTAKPGLSGLAQVNGRNEISWEDKIDWDLKYIEKVSLKEDLKIIFETVKKAFIKQEGITQDNMATAEDYGDYLLRTEKIDKSEYEKNQYIAKKILSGEDAIERIEGLVSVIMPSYNTAPYIEETIQSVLNQTYTNWELIIVDDCSTDNTDEVLETIKDDRIRYFKNEKNSGAAVSRNKALREAKGQWIAYLDSDDLWMPEKLEKQIRFMEENGYIFSYTNYEEIDVDGYKTGVKVTGPKKITKTGMFNYCWPGCLTVMYDANKIGLIQIEDIKKNNDYAMWLKVCRKADCYLLDEILGQYRKGRLGSVSTHSIRTMIGWHYKLFTENEKMKAITAFICTIRNLLFGFWKKIRYVERKYDAKNNYNKIDL